MKRTVIAASLVLGTVSFTTAARAEAPATGGAHGLGLGMASMLTHTGRATGPSGLSVAYDAGAWHLDTMLSLYGNGDTTYAIGARGWYHMHQTPGADFSLGGGLGFRHYDRGDDDATAVHIDLGFLVRAFLTPSVALSAFGGLSLVPGDDPFDGFALDGQLGGFGGFGLHYYFH